jgi:sugar phosphate isomerase/epimerase
VLPGKEGQLAERGAERVSRNLWAYVEPADVAQAFRLALALPRVDYEAFLIGAADTLSPIPSLELARGAFDALPEVRRPEWFAANPHASLYDIRKAMRVLGYRPGSDWRPPGPGGRLLIPDSRFAFMARLDFAAWPPERVVAALKGLGYGGVSWMRQHFHPRTHALGDLRALLQTTRDAGLAVTELVVQQDLVCLDEAVRRDRIAVVGEYIEAAAAAGRPLLNVFTGPASWDPGAPRIPRDLSEGTAWDMVDDAYRQVTAVAEAHGVTLVVEAVFGQVVRDYFTTRELLRRVPSPALAVNLDPSHYHLYRNDILPSGSGADRLRPHEDAVGVPGLPGQEFLFPLLGEGSIDWTAFLAALDAAGYRGFLTVEFESFAYYRQVLGRDPVAAARLSLEALRRLVGGDGKDSSTPG